MKALIIFIRLLLTAAFFLGLVWVIRMESAWKVVAGVTLMVTTVPANYWIIGIINPAMAEKLRFAELFSSSLVVTGPIILFFLAIAGLYYFSQSGDMLILVPFIFTVFPLFGILTDAFQGNHSWDATDIARSYAQRTTVILGKLFLIFLTLAVFAMGIAGAITLLMTLGDLIWQGFFAASPSETPLLCQLQRIDAKRCSATLISWHGVTIGVVFIAWRYGEKFVDRVIEILASL